MVVPRICSQDERLSLCRRKLGWQMLQPGTRGSWACTLQTLTANRVCPEAVLTHGVPKVRVVNEESPLLLAVSAKISGITDTRNACSALKASVSKQGIATISVHCKRWGPLKLGVPLPWYNSLCAVYSTSLHHSVWQGDQENGTIINADDSSTVSNKLPFLSDLGVSWCSPKTGTLLVWSSLGENLNPFTVVDTGHNYYSRRKGESVCERNLSVFWQ